MDYHYIQIIDARQLVTIVASRCEKVGMVAGAHARLALSFRPGVDKISPYHKILSMKTPNLSILRTAVPYLKVFGWDLAVKIEGREYVIGDLVDMVKVFEEYREEHDYLRWYLEKDLLKGYGGPSVSRLIYGTIHDMYVETFRTAVERIGGHLFIRQVKRTYNINRRYRNTEK